MSQRPRPIPVGILVSVSGSRKRRKFRSVADFPSIKKEVNLPLRVGLGVVAILSLLTLGVCAYSVLEAAPTRPVAQANAWKIIPAILHDEPPPAQPQTPPAEPPAAPAEPVVVATAPPVADAPATPRSGPLADLLRHVVAQASRPTPTSPPVCSNLGTEISFRQHPPDAFRQAAKENKLVLMVHLSGNFEDQAFT